MALCSRSFTLLQVYVILDQAYDKSRHLREIGDRVLIENYLSNTEKIVANKQVYGNVHFVISHSLKLEIFKQLHCPLSHICKLD